MTLPFHQWSWCGGCQIGLSLQQGRLRQWYTQRMTPRWMLAQARSERKRCLWIGLWVRLSVMHILHCISHSICMCHWHLHSNVHLHLHAFCSCICICNSDCVWDLVCLSRHFIHLKLNATGHIKGCAFQVASIRNSSVCWRWNLLPTPRPPLECFVVGLQTFCI